MGYALAVRYCASKNQPLHGAEILVEAWLLEFRVVPAQVVAAERRVRAASDPKQPATERPVAQNAILFCGKRRISSSDAALEQVIGRLQHMQRRDASESVHLRRPKIAHPDGADLPWL